MQFLPSRVSITHGMPLFHSLCSFQSTRYGQSFKGLALSAPLVQYSVYRIRLQSSKGCFPLLLVQLSGYQIQAIIRGICFSSIACVVFSLPSTVIIIQGMPSLPARASRLDTGNYPRDTLFQHCLCSLQSTKYGYARHGQSSR